VGLQEVGDPDALEDLVRILDGEWEQRLSQHSDRRGIRVGWLSRHPITASQDLFAFPEHISAVQVDDEGGTQTTMGRGALMIAIEIGNQSVQLVTAHLKSKLLTFPGNRHQPRDEDERARFAAYALYRRAAEAASLRVAVTAALSGLGRERSLVLAGDQRHSPGGHHPTSPGASWLRLDTPGFAQPDQGDQQRLWNLAPRMPPKQDFSRKHRGREELIDHILVSAALVKNPDLRARAR
jgi:hypothetical protein